MKQVGGKARSGHYDLRDNFLRAWLSALQRPVSASAFRPMAQSIAQADERLAETEGFALEGLAGQLYEERSRRGLGDFPLSARIQGYWDRGDVEIDLVALCEDERRLRFGSCKRNPDRLLASVAPLRRCAEQFLAVHRSFADWTVEYVAIAPMLDATHRARLASEGVMAQSLQDLTRGL